MKKVSVRTPLALALCLLAGLFVFACSGGGGGGGDSTSGTLSTSLTDSFTEDYQAVYVTIARVDVHHDDDGTWETVAEPDQTYNLLELVNGVRATLGITALDAGHYTQMRLIIGTLPDDGTNILDDPHPFANYVIDQNDGAHEMKVPSGTNTGLKIVNGFDINENRTTELILDFDAMRSVVKAGKSGKYLLKPTVKVLNTIDYALVLGTVTDTPPVTTPPTAPTALPGAMVTAQSTDALAADAMDLVSIEAGTVTDATGEYALALLEGSYNLVATASGYLPACSARTLAEDSTTTVDFQLATPAGALGTISGTVTIDTVPGDTFATVQFRRSIDCGSGATTIIVDSVNVGDGGTYSLELPAGDYTVVAAASGETTQSLPLTVVSGAQTLDISFVTP